jgi:hypothetical protein
MENHDVPDIHARPTLLLILAIFTILGSALTIIGAFLPEDFSGMRADMPASPGWVTALTMASAVVKLGGAILLIQMRRWGFFVYLGGELVALFLNLKTGMDLMQWADATNTSGMAIDPVVFALVLVGGMVLLSVVWVGGYAAFLSRMR